MLDSVLSVPLLIPLVDMLSMGSDFLEVSEVVEDESQTLLGFQTA